jgi:hypothetical protein
MLVIGIGVRTGLMNGAIVMVRWRIKRVELHRHEAGINDIVLCFRRNHNSEASVDCSSDTIQCDFTAALLDVKELIHAMRFLPDIFARLQCNHFVITCVLA